jgi:hypothetical protein
MQRNWTNRNVNMNLLKEKIIGFFMDHNFDVVDNELASGFQLLAKGSPDYEMDGEVRVTVLGEPKEFSVDLELQRKGKGRLPSSMLLTQLLGGGYFLLRNFRSDEAWIEFRRLFWEQADRIIMGLSDSAEL